VPKKKLLIAGGGYADIPLIKAGRKLGYYVISSGNRPDELGHKYSDQYQKCDFSDQKALLALARSLKIDAICPCTNDFSALSSAYVAEKLGLKGHDSLQVTKILHHKDKYRTFCKENKIRAPKAKDYMEPQKAIKDLDSFDLPVIVKPVDLTGGKGITRIDSKDKASQAINNAFNISKNKRIVIEEFIHGSNHGLSTLIVNKKVKFYFADNEHYFINKYMVSGASTPTSVSKKNIKSLIEELEKMASILKLKDGILHVQFILNNNTPYIIEICRRPPGDLYVDFVTHATGINYAAFIVKSFTGASIADIEHTEPNGYHTRHCVMANTPGKVKNIVFDKLIQSKIIDKFMWCKKGDVIKNHLVQKCGIVFLSYDSKKDMLKTTCKLNNFIKVITE